MKYDRSKFRELIKSLTAQELDESLDSFPSVRNQFTDGQQKYLRDRIILDYFERHQEDFLNFLKAIQECNSEAYNNYVNNLNGSDNKNILPLSGLKVENSDSQLIEELTDIFSQQDDLFWQCVKQVYQDFLWQLNEPDLEFESDNLREHLLLQLEDWTEKTIILEFIPRLLAYLSNKDSNQYLEIVRILQKIVKKHIDIYPVMTMDAFKEALRNFKQEYKKSSNINYLIIEIKDSQSHPNLFQISGWLAKNNIPDYLKPLNNQQLRVETEEKRTQEQYYKKENIEEIVKSFITQITESEEIQELIIEFFLPSSLFGWEVDKWKFDSSNKICLGIVHEVRIRSLDRMKPMYKLYKNRWENKWRYLKRCVSPLPQFLNSDINCNVNTLIGQLQDNKIIGLKLTSALKSNHEEIASALYYSGTPIALWFRSEPPEGDCKTELDNLLQHDLLQLSMQVRQQRSQPERHISLIWDDPNRLIPTYQLK
ncbi:MAG: hypothetical protein KME54_25180 [Tolypothrix brevis GSE-NOS-MK-07-07A]|jgi:hypothetical protein|nr:hypothetical protein [Tolypothrix brevis GSE-NOS-MK-07-07A]